VDSVAEYIKQLPGGVKTVSLIATAVIGVAPVLILEVITLIKVEKDKTVINHSLLKTMLGFAVGGLLGDVFLHLLPHAINPHSHNDEGHDAHSHSHSHGEEAHDHSNDITIGVFILAGMLTFFLLEKYMRIRQQQGGGSSHGHSHSHSHADGGSGGRKNGKAKTEPAKKSKEKGGINPGAYLNIIADSAHNFTDGMAIAASFLISYKVGISTTIAVFFP
jgi:zinc transporter 7